MIQNKLAQLPFLSHDVNNKNRAAFAPAEDSTRLYVQLAVNRIGQRGWKMAGIWKLFKAVDRCEYLLNEARGGLRLVQGYVFRDLFQLIQRRACPDYFSHFCIRSLAWA